MSNPYDDWDDEGWGEPQKSTLWDLKEMGPLSGVYLGYKEVVGDYGTSRLHEFKTKSGGTSKVFGKTHLDQLLDGRQGELVKVELTGDTIDMGKGRNPMIEYALYSKGRLTAAPSLPERPLQTPEKAAEPQGGGEDSSPF